MNPFGWKREHQVALAVSILAGFSIGLAFGYARDSHSGGFYDWLITAINPNYPTYAGAGWAIFGAIIGGAAAYVIQMQRR